MRPRQLSARSLALPVDLESWTDLYFQPPPGSRDQLRLAATMQRGCSLLTRTPLQPSVRTRASRGAGCRGAQRCPQRTAAGRRLRLACSAAAAAEPVPVMVNGITGKMGFATAEAAVQRGLRLLPVAFSGALQTCHPLACPQLTCSVQPRGPAKA